MVVKKVMVSEAICGRCGSILESPSAVCLRCGLWPQPARVAPAGKSPLVAAVLAVIPGLGHFYLGHYRKAAAFMAGLILLQFFDFDLDLTVVGALIGAPLELGGLGLWLFSIFDAYRIAKLMNQSA